MLPVGVNPCGRAVDLLRSGYVVYMRTFRPGPGSPEPVRVVWYRVPDEAPLLEGWTPFRSRNYEDFDGIYPSLEFPTQTRNSVWRSLIFPVNSNVGEQVPWNADCCKAHGNWYSGAAPAGYDGRHLCGSAEAWQNGAVWGVDPVILTGPKGVPECCGQVTSYTPDGGITLDGLASAWQSSGYSYLPIGGVPCAGESEATVVDWTQVADYNWWRNETTRYQSWYWAGRVKPDSRHNQWLAIEGLQIESANTIIMPLFLPRGATVEEIGVFCLSANDDLDICAFAIYDNVSPTDPYPDAIRWEGSVLNVDIAAANTIVSQNVGVTLEAGLYWLAFTWTANDFPGFGLVGAANVDQYPILGYIAGTGPCGGFIDVTDWIDGFPDVVDPGLEPYALLDGPPGPQMCPLICVRFSGG